MDFITARAFENELSSILEKTANHDCLGLVPPSVRKTTGKEKDSNMGAGTYGPASGMKNLPGVIDNMKMGMVGKGPSAESAEPSKKVDHVMDRVREMVGKKEKKATGDVPQTWGQAAKSGLHHEGPGAGGMLLGTIVGGRYGRPLEGAALGYGAGAGLGLLADKAVQALKAKK